MSINQLLDGIIYLQVGDFAIEKLGTHGSLKSQGFFLNNQGHPCMPG